MNFSGGFHVGNIGGVQNNSISRNGLGFSGDAPLSWVQKNQMQVRTTDEVDSFFRFDGPDEDDEALQSSADAAGDVTPQPPEFRPLSDGTVAAKPDFTTVQVDTSTGVSLIGTHRFEVVHPKLVWPANIKMFGDGNLIVWEFLGIVFFL